MEVTCVAARCLYEQAIPKLDKWFEFFYFIAQKYKHGVKTVTARVLAQSGTYFIGTVKQARCDLTSWQTVETGMSWVWTVQLMKTSMQQPEKE